jgi:hypothetical protein
MKVKILLSIGYIILFALLGYRASMPNPNMGFILGAFFLFSGCFAHLWLNDTVSKGKN